ncbi:MAG: hypothetical protein RIB60_06115 [Phycisphaerales bacterium]
MSRDGMGNNRERTRLAPGAGQTGRTSKTLLASGSEPRQVRDPQATSSPTFQFGDPLYLDSDRRMKIRVDSDYLKVEGDKLTLSDAVREALGL